MSIAYQGLRLLQPTQAGVAIYPPGATFGPRVMRDFEFVWIIEGDAEYTWGDTTVAAPSPAIVLCRPGAQDSFRWDPDRRTRHAYYHFNIDRLPKAWPPASEWPLMRIPPEGDVLRPLFRHILTWHDSGDALVRELTIAQMLAAYVTGEIAGRDVGRDALPDAVERALAFLHEHLENDAAESITLHDLADAAAVTPEHLCRLFKQATGRSPAETVRLARLDRAAVLLARSNYSVGQIAELCGFASQFHFSRRFKEAYGRSPKVLRREIAAGAVPPVPKLLRTRS
jgi:AraC family transcriptional regulator